MNPVLDEIYDDLNDFGKLKLMEYANDIRVLKKYRLPSPMSVLREAILLQVEM